MEREIAAPLAKHPLPQHAAEQSGTLDQHREKHRELLEAADQHLDAIQQLLDENYLEQTLQTGGQ